MYFGKPHEEVYNICLKKDEKTLVIGDNLKTDIKGANNLNLDSLFIKNESGNVNRQYVFI